MENIKNIAAALVGAQRDMSNAIKDSNNPFFKSKYADLNSIREACLPPLNANGIVVLQPICQVNDKNYVKTILLHESGETIESLTEIIYSKHNDAQSQGSGITYARRYGLQSLICIGAEDDDGNAASVEFEWQNSKEGRKWINDNFIVIKTLIEACESEDELKASWKDKAVDIARMKRYAKKQFDLLTTAKDFMKTAFDQAKELDAPE